MTSGFFKSSIKSKMQYARLQQGLVAIGLIACSFSDGFIFGQMSGMINALHNKETAIQLDDEDISWIASMINVTCFCGFAVMTVLTEIFGRKKTLTMITVPVIVTWIVLYFAQDKYTLIISRIIVGLSFGGIQLLLYVNIGEYMPPDIRSLILNIVGSFGSTAGAMLGHILSVFLNWRNVALIGIIPSAISAIIPLFWLESPSWLASKGRFEECEKSFKALHVRSQASERELKMLIQTEKLKAKESSKKNNSQISMLRKFIQAFKYKYFWKISMLNHVISIYRVAAGRVLFNTFIITMIQDITGTHNILLYTLLIDGFALLGSGLSCILVLRFKMRKLFFTTGILANVILLTAAICLYFWSNSSPYVVWTKVTLLALYFITITAGPYPVVETALSEIQPLEIKAITVLYVGSVNGIIQFLSIKYASSMFNRMGYHGVFLLNAGIVFLCLLYLYICLPEMKGRTLQEIEYYFKHGSFENVSPKMSESDNENNLHVTDDELRELRAM